MIAIDYNKKIPCPISKKLLQKSARMAANRESKIKGAVEVTVVGEKEIKKINHKYRGISKVTDVLSFAWGEGGKVKSGLLGELYICYPQIVRQAREFNVGAREEFIRMFIHGLLHLVGYDHTTAAKAKKMFSLQEKAVAEAN